STPHAVCIELWVPVPPAIGIPKGDSHETTSRFVGYTYGPGDASLGRPAPGPAPGTTRPATRRPTAAGAPPRQPGPSAAAPRGAAGRTAGGGALRGRTGEPHAARQP